MPSRLLLLLFVLCPVPQVIVLQSAAGEVPDPVQPEVAEASSEGARALQGFRVSDGLVGSLFAAEPLVANPVAFYVDSHNRVFVCESYRQQRGVTDNRGHSQEWLDADLAAESVEDRRRYHQALLGDDLPTFTEQDDRIRVVLDTNQDGIADTSHVFADRFNGLVEGTGAGVLELDGDVFYTCIPNLWRMRDHDGDDKADSREILHTGYGVRVAFRGHDLHGLRLGPDGRLYFSIGDRGANIETPRGRVKNTESGSVFRCELDGSKLEIFATGLRNPQELAFDNYGNLFTGDNNSDSGDRARWVYVVEGGDSGWRMAYQYLSDRGPFNREKLWHPFHEGQAAYLIPPVANIADGPSGLDYYPGTGFSDAFKGRFFLADFRGTPSQSGVRSFRVEPTGAFFRLAEDDQQPIWSILATDVQFAPDGGLYVSDWVNGWEGEGKGRIYRFASKEHQHDPIVREVKTLLGESFAQKNTSNIAALLAHPDQRIRLKSQYELASRRATRVLSGTAVNSSSQLARLHAMWALEQIARDDEAQRPETASQLLQLLDDGDTEIRAHAARLLGEVRGDHSAPDALRRRLSDQSARVRYFAAQSLGKLGVRDAISEVVAMLQENNNRDPVLRHGGVMALSRIASDSQLAELSGHGSIAVRLAAVVALRRQRSAEAAKFLQDENPFVVLEAARAIHDQPISAALPQLAALISSQHENDALMRRVLNANFRLGTASHAVAIAAFAAKRDKPADLRLEAIEMLGDWQSPNGRDRVLGMWRPIGERNNRVVIEALRPVIAKLGNDAPEIRLAAARVGSDLQIEEAAPVLSRLATDTSVQPSQRADALRSLASMLGADSLSDIDDAIDDESATVRAAGLELFAELDPAAAAPVLQRAALDGEVEERQAAIRALGGLESDVADETVVELLRQLVNHELAAEVQLEALTAAQERATAEVKNLLATYESMLDPSQPLDPYRETLRGGDSTRGRQIFFEKTSVGCVRCHKVFDRGGEVGPELGRIAAEKDREYLLEAIVDPNKAIAKGFESILVLDVDGQTHVGVLREENDTQLVLMDADAKTIIIPKDMIDLRQPSKSAMPEDLVKQLTKAELRDLVEYLASLDGRRRFGRFQRAQN